ncbi:MAG: hypothetical protein ACKOED_02005 [Aestuariivirga sp.]|uniref:hypothetical protein n=1 Tax=Aestuariivirga sp. TaxID=2650926 RepID=UPI0038D00EBC
MELFAQLLETGLLRFPADPEMRAWADHAGPVALAATRDPANAHWLRCGGTWFVGVDALPNDETGRVAGGPPLAGAAMDFLRVIPRLDLPLHRAQLSVCYPGYPQPSPQESEAAFRFRRDRDAAHVDGLLAEGPAKRRFLREPHAYILGIALTAQSPDAAPLVAWEGSHRIMGEALSGVLGGHPAKSWPDIDLTEAYQAARRQVFASCRRIVLPAMPGEAVLLHRHMLHGVAPWGHSATATPAGRMVAYFRPQFENLADWLDQP